MPRYNICISNRSKLRVERVKEFLVRSTRSFERFFSTTPISIIYLIPNIHMIFGIVIPKVSMNFGIRLFFF